MPWPDRKNALRLDVIEAGVQSHEYFGFAYNVYSDTFTRLGKAQGVPNGVMCPMTISPVLSRLRMVTLTDAGAVTKEISWLDKTKYTDGSSVPLGGTDGQVMVEYLPAYVKIGTWGNWYYVMISHLPLSGFAIHPLFTGTSAVYQATFEGSVYNPGPGNKLYSIAKSPADGASAVYPVSERAGAWGLTGTNAVQMDAIAAARGPGWMIQDWLTVEWQRLLMIAAFGTYDVPAVVGLGRVSLSGGSWINDSFIGKCGLGLAASLYYGAVQAGGTSGYLTDYSFVLGIENPWGNLWDRVGGVVVSDGAFYYKPSPPYDYSAVNGMTRLVDADGTEVTLPVSSGYGGRPWSGRAMMLPKDLTGSTSTRMRDYYYCLSSLRVLRVGGISNSGSLAGPFSWFADLAASETSSYIGGRLCFKKAA